MEKILVVDDDPCDFKTMKRRLEAVVYQVVSAREAEKAIRVTKDGSCDFVPAEPRVSGHGRAESLPGLHQGDCHVSAVVRTDCGSPRKYVGSRTTGVHIHDTKLLPNEALVKETEKSPGRHGVLKHSRSRKGVGRDRRGFKDIISQSERMEKVFEQAWLATESDSNVYIEGESGTGKELIARALHVTSSRKDGPFVAINCAAIPETLLESELFGYEKGAFTGAAQDKEGLLSRAHTGTLLLDEISEMPLSMQAKFLRVLQDKEFYPVGGTQTKKIDARIIATSNRKLEQEVGNGDFRKDLFYRIHVIVIQLPPLRKRREDIPLLAGHFLKKFSEETHKEIIGFSPAALQKLMLHTWPGNVRELENTIESAVAMTTEPIISEGLILPTRDFEGALKEDSLRPLKEAKEGFEKEYLVQLIERTRGNVTQAAKVAGKYRADLYELLKKHNIKLADYR